MAWEIEFGAKRTPPSPKHTLTPPVCLLRACACQLGQLFGRLSLEQPICKAPSPLLPTPKELRTALQSSMSSEYSFESLGTVASPMELAAVTLAPPTPMAQTPRRSLVFRPMRTSLNMTVLDDPSRVVRTPRLMPKLMPNGPPALAAL